MKTSNSVHPITRLTAKTKLPTLWGEKSDGLARLDRWLWAAQDIVNDYYSTKLSNLTPSLLEMSDGRRYIRVDCIVDGGLGQRSVWAFIDKTNGDILKPAGYKAPAKHARGNLFDINEGIGMLTPEGPVYLR
jgi:hypothetical protein